MSSNSSNPQIIRTRRFRAAAPVPGQLAEFDFPDNFLDIADSKESQIPSCPPVKLKRKNRRERDEEDEWEKFDEICDVEDEDEDESEEEKEEEEKKPKKKKMRAEKEEEEEEEEMQEEVAPPIVDGALPAPPASWYRITPVIDLVSDTDDQEDIDDDVDAWDAAYEDFLAEELSRQHEYFLGDRNFID